MGFAGDGAHVDGYRKQPSRYTGVRFRSRFPPGIGLFSVGFQTYFSHKSDTFETVTLEISHDVVNHSAL